ncbi:MAG: hypothetical protein EPN21_00670 [Methylococcaceae bacterium]|nr:MAG: hypothetical protein EPN21_00670 [Methylococcaceae bacterium]
MSAATLPKAGRMNRLTNPAHPVQTVPAAPHWAAGRDNPVNRWRIKRPARRYFFAWRFSMAAGAGQAHAWPVSNEPVCHPRISRHHSRRDKRLGGSKTFIVGVV